jgi:hydrogenase expression/formation protein HypD
MGHDPRAIEALIARIRQAAGARPLALMEVCGTHTHAIGAAGLRRLLPPTLRLVSGPGCPVCVTPVAYLDRAEALAALPATTLCTFGDLFRVPSSRGSLERAAAGGARVRIVYSPRDALQWAREHPAERVIFLSIGFETTTPTVAAALAEAEADGIENFFVLPGNKCVPPALHALCRDVEARIDGFILPGHVSVITGAENFRFLAQEYRRPAIVAGFTPGDVLRAIEELVGQLAAGAARLANLYTRVVTAGGNREAQALSARFFEPAEARWRGIGTLPGSGLRLRSRWAHRDASRIEVSQPAPREPAGCRCGEVLRGQLDPPDCPLFGRDCTPERPVGACMVSSEGACAAWHRHERIGA